MMPNPDYSKAGTARDNIRRPAVDVQAVVDAALVDYPTTVEVAATYTTPSDVDAQIAAVIPSGTTKGDILYWDGTGWAIVANGTGTLHNDGSGTLTWS